MLRELGQDDPASSAVQGGLRAHRLQVAQCLDRRGRFIWQVKQVVELRLGCAGQLDALLGDSLAVDPGEPPSGDCSKKPGSMLMSLHSHVVRQPLLTFNLLWEATSN